MNNRLLAPAIYIIALAAFCLSAYVKLSGAGIHPLIPFLCCFISQAVFSSICIYEVTKSDQLNPIEKRNWRIYLFFLPLVFGFFYLGMIRKRTVSPGIEVI